MVELNPASVPPEDDPAIDAGMDVLEEVPDFGDDGPLDIACPNQWCGSEPGERCVNMAQMRAGTFLPKQVPFHPARKKAWAPTGPDQEASDA